MAPPAGIPVSISNGSHTGIFRCQAFQGSVYGLFFRTYQPHLHLALMEGKDLGSEHGGICNSDELQTRILGVIPGNNKKPGTVRGSVNMGGLYGPV